MMYRSLIVIFRFLLILTGELLETPQLLASLALETEP